MKHPRLIIEEKRGDLVISFSGPALRGLKDINVLGQNAEKIIDQVRKLHSPTGEIHIEFPDRDDVEVIRNHGPKPVAA